MDRSTFLTLSLHSFRPFHPYAPKLPQIFPDIRPPEKLRQKDLSMSKYKPRDAREAWNFQSCDRSRAKKTRLRHVFSNLESLQVKFIKLSLLEHSQRLYNGKNCPYECHSVWQRRDNLWQWRRWHSGYFKIIAFFVARTFKNSVFIDMFLLL